MMAEPNRKVFVSYSHKDEKWLKVLQTYLKRLEVAYPIEFWSDKKIVAGTNWQDEIEKSISASCAALLLVSEDFLASDFITQNELPPLLNKASRDGNILIFPLHIEPSSFLYKQNINQFQSLNSPNKPLSQLSNPERRKALVEAVEKIWQALEKKAMLLKEDIPFSNLGMEIIHEAEELAKDQHYDRVERAHLFLALLKSSKELSQKIFGENVGKLEIEIYNRLNVKLPSIENVANVWHTTGLNRAFVNAENIAKQLDTQAIEPVHLYHALLEDPGKTLDIVLLKFQVNKLDVMKLIVDLEKNSHESYSDDNY